MATKETPKAPKTPKVTAEAKKDNVPVVDVSAKDAEIESLRSENASFKSQLEAMQNQLSQFMGMMQMMSKASNTDEVRDIEIINLAVGQLILTTNGRSDGIHYEFTEQFKKLMVPETDLKQIIKAMPKTVESGLFFINDDEFVRKNGLTYVYRNIMNEETIRGFFTKPHKEAIELYENANKAQQDIIETMVVTKLLDGEDVDANILRDLGKATGKNFMDIEPLEALKEG